MKTPPSGNTGALLTAPLENQILIDYLAFTIPTENVSKAFEVLLMPSSWFTELERGGMGYKKRMQYGHIVVFYDGTEGMGVHVEMSGKGCREFESFHNMIDFLKQLESFNIKVTRLDLAIDTVDDSLKIEQIEKALSTGNVRSRFSKTRIYQESSITSEGLKDHSYTRYFGSGSSNTQFRVYDKAVEQNIPDCKWVRFELQLRKDVAQSAVELLIKTNVGYVATGIINQYFAFIEKTDSNISRCPLIDWWFEWLQHTDKLQLTKRKVLNLVPQIKDFIKRQYAPTFSVLKKALGSVEFLTFISDLTYEGESRMTAKHKLIIELSQIFQGGHCHA